MSCIIQAVDADIAQGVDVEIIGDWKVIKVPFRGLSRGMGEFMELTLPMTSGDWTCWMQADMEFDPLHIIEASRTAPSLYWALALTEDSPLSHAWTRKIDAGWREVPFVDLGIVCHRRVLDIAGRHFMESRSAWGLDLILADVNRALTGHTAHVCDDYTARHTKPVESQHWLIDGRTPWEEMQHIRRKFNV